MKQDICSEISVVKANNDENNAMRKSSQFFQEPVCALSSESIFLIQVSDFLGQISNVATQLVVPKSQNKIHICNIDAVLRD